MMPRMNGAELARRVKRQRPDLPILLVTGYADLAEPIDLPRLAKPFGQSELAEWVKALTGGASNVVAIRSRPRS